MSEEKRKHNLDGVKKRERAHPVVFWETSGRGTVWSLPRSWGRNLLCKCKICFFILSYFAVLHSRFRDFCFKYGWEKDLIRDVCCSWASLSSTPPPPPPPPGLCSTPHPVIKYQPFAAGLWCGFVMPLRGWHWEHQKVTGGLVLEMPSCRQAPAAAAPGAAGLALPFAGCWVDLPSRRILISRQGAPGWWQICCLPCLHSVANAGNDETSCPENTFPFSAGTF